VKPRFLNTDTGSSTAKKRLLLVCLLALAAPGATAAAPCWSDAELGAKLLETKDRLGVSLLFDFEGYYVDQRPGGLLMHERSFLAPRLSLFLDKTLGDHFYVFLQARADTGFDPGYANHEARLDEYLLRWTPWTDGRLNLQAGKFATVVGNWVHRHDSWNNPFVTAPLAYENMTIVTDAFAPGSPAAFLARKNVREAPSQKGRWLPVLWGPAYTTGASIFGSLERFDYAFEFKNASISSRPPYWGIEELDWDNPTWSLRMGHRPTAAWNYGVSASYGTYLLPPAQATLPAGRGLEDYHQVTLGWDLSYAKRKWQLWGEAFWSRFQVPNVGNADTFTYYLEAKYKITARAFAAARWNQQLFGSVPDGLGGEQRWGHNIFRVDGSLGYRFSRHLQGKVQYSFSHQAAAWQKGEQLVAGQATLKF